MGLIWNGSGSPIPLASHRLLLKTENKINIVINYWEYLVPNIVINYVITTYWEYLFFFFFLLVYIVIKSFADLKKKI